MLDKQDRTPDLDPTVAAHSVLGMVHGVVLWYKTQTDLTPDELIDQVTQLALRGLIADPPMTPDPKAPRGDVERRRQLAGQRLQKGDVRGIEGERVAVDPAAGDGRHQGPGIDGRLEEG